MLFVEKFGGSSLAGVERVRCAARLIADTVRAGHSVAAVLSAQGKTTDALLSTAAHYSRSPSKRELDMLLATGEQASVALMAMTLEEMGLPAVSLTGWQAGVGTDETYGDAHIRRLSMERVRRELDEGKVVLIAGFQGVSPGNDITTLGRGGSDTTAVAAAEPKKVITQSSTTIMTAAAAVAAAAALRADECRIYTDVEGVFTADPRLIPEARRLSAVDSEEMLRLASLGSQVLHERSAALALRFAVPLTVLSSLVPAPGTVIRPLPLPEDEGRLTAVTRSGALVSLVGTHLHTFASLPERAAAALREAGLSPDAVLLTDGRLTVHVPEAQSLETLRCLHAAFLETKDHS